MSDLGSLQQRIVAKKTDFFEINKRVSIHIKIKITLFSVSFIVFVVRSDKQRQFSIITRTCF